MKKSTQKTDKSLIVLLTYLLITYFLCPLDIYANDETPVACTGTVINTYPYSESFETGIGAWTQNGGDDGDWTRDANGTASNNTGPSAASNGTWYMYTEANNGGSNLGPNSTAILTSPCIDLSAETEAYFSFDYHMYGSNTGSIVVEISSNAGGTWTPAFSISGQQQNANTSAWRKEIIDLTAFAGNTINVRISGTTGGGQRSDMAIDNINVTNTQQYCGSMGSLTNTNIRRVNFNTIDNNTTTQAIGYSDFTSLSTNVVQNEVHPLTVQVNTNGNSTSFVYAWIDWNQDFIFDNATEGYNLGSTTNSTNGATSNSPLNITVPITAIPGVTRMRVSSRNGAFSGSCDEDNGFAGEVEDYSINVIAATPAPEMDVTGLGTSIADGDVAPSVLDDTDFGTLTTGMTESHLFTITNSGNLPLNLTDPSPYITITGSTYFTLTIVPSSPIAISGGSTTFEITYAPILGGTHNATISIANDDSDENPYNFSVTGASTAPTPEMDVSGLGISIMDGDTTPDTIDDTDFGTVTVGNVNSNTFTITNTGNLDLSLTDPSPYVTITGSPYFSITTIPNNTIGMSGGTTTFAIVYTPLAGGTHTATLSIANNDSDENPYNFSISGMGIGPEPEIGLIGLNNNILDGDNTPSTTDGTDFGNLLIGSSTFTDFTIANTGSSDLILTDPSPYVTITGAGAAQFTLTTAPTSPIPSSGGTTIFRVTYNPTVGGTHDATITIANNDTNENPYNFDITGFAAATLIPEIDVLGNNITIPDGDILPDTADGTDFGTIEIGTASTSDFTIENVGTGLLTLTGTSPYVTITGTGASEFSVVTIPSNTITAGDNTIFQITYQPTTVGIHVATITIANDDADESPYNFDIIGEGINPVNRYYTVYYENFDANNGGWAVTNPGGQTVWTYGQNAGETTGNGNYFYTSTYNNYVDNSDTYATSPVINLFGFTDLRLQIDVRFDLQNDVDDAMNIEYSSDGGATWNVLGTTAEPAANKWYNETDADGLGNEVDGWSNINDSSFNASKSQFSVSFIDLPPILTNNPIARFRVRFASDGDGVTDNGANFDNFIITGNPMVPITDPANGPADVTSNLELWLKADTGIAAASGSQVTLWSDQAKDNDALITNENAPTYFDSQIDNINHNPVITFNEANRTQLKGKGGYYSQDYWIVLRQEGTIDGTTSGAYEGVLGGRNSDSQFSEDGSGFWTGNISIRFTGEDNMLSHMVGTTPNSIGTPNTSYGRAYSSSTDSYTDEVIIINIKANSGSTSSEIYKNGIKVDNTDGFASNGSVLPYTDYINSPFSLGVSYAGLNRTDISTWFNGQITEFISYSSSASTFDQKRIQSYLAIKNGVTLHSINSVTPTREGDENYVDSNGNTIWSSDANFNFNYDIAGIGRDDASGLNQKQSTSSNPGAVVTMGLTDIFTTNNENINSNPDEFTNQNFLMWGNNNQSFDAADPIQVDLSNGVPGLNTVVDFTAVERIWKVVETGSVGTVKVSIPEISLSATLSPPGDYLMFVSDTPSFSPTSEYRIMTLNGANLETTYNFNGAKYITFGYAPEYFYERSVSFDGVQDYLDVGDALDRTGAFTISAWIKRINNDYSIISKRDAAFSEGYDISILNDDHVEMSWINGLGTQDIQSTVPIPENEWHHIAFIYDGASTIDLYIDGFLDNTDSTVSAPIGTDQSFIIGAADGTITSDFYQGAIDEVRVWDIALSTDQLRFIMNQEIEDNSTFVGGKIVPTTISKNEFATTTWANNLVGYFPMNRYTFTNIKDESNSNLVAAIKNLETVDFQTAPLPYISALNGDWTSATTWNNGSTQELPGAASISDNTFTIDWNIVQTAHNVITNSNNTVLSLDVQSNELSIENDSKIEISHYLKLDGLLDLVGESQLVQTENSDLDVSSAGSIERDQQGTADTYSYNGWSAPVSTINTSTNNQNYTVSSLMLDGSNVNSPTSMLFSGGYNGAATTPITISAYWIWKYANNPANTYAAWQYVGPSGTMEVGEGYTMKGPGTGGITDPQNYTYRGKPNNSTDIDEINLDITAGNQYFVGNPFPSALDADDFIVDNPHLDGTLYFWEHWGGNTHVIDGYQAGYATYTLGGGVPAASHPSVDQTGSGTKTPGRYIPVGQGFFTEATSTGTIVFNNSQRNFVRETSGSSFFFFSGHTNANQNDGANAQDQSRDDTYYDAPDQRQKFRFVYDSPDQYHREILLTVDEKTTFEYDRMFDGINPGGPDDDMKWMIGDAQAVIQVIPHVDNIVELPLQVKVNSTGISSISISDIENENLLTEVYLKDALLDTYTNLKEQPFTINLAPATYNDRFYIVFKTDDTVTAPGDTNQDQNTTTSNDTDSSNDQSHDESNEQTDAVIIAENLEEINTIDLTVNYNQNSSSIVINKDNTLTISNASLYSMLGQIIKQWTPNSEGTTITLPVTSISTGAYVIYLETQTGTITKKLIIH